MTEPANTSQIPVLVTGESRLLSELLAGHLAEVERFDLADELPNDPSGLIRAMRGIPSKRAVGVLADPVGDEWVDAADWLRSQNPHYGVVVVTARPDYAKQRRWQRELPSGGHRAHALLSVASDAGDLADAIVDAYERPHIRSQFWLEGPRHPFALTRTDSGRASAAVRGKPKLHQTLVLEARGTPRRVAGRKLDGIGPRQVGERIARLKEMLDASTDVELGYRAAELGLLDDIEAFDDE